MKKILLVMMCFLLLCSFCMTVSAADNGIYENAGQLYAFWVSGDCVPDYISGVWSTDGGTDNLTFGVVAGETGEKGRQEILALIRDDTTVTIVFQTYSRNELYRIQDEVVDAYFDKSLGLVTAGVREIENRLHFEIKTSYSDNAETLAMIRKVTAQYGDAVSFSFTDSDIQFVAGNQPPISPPLLVMRNPDNLTVPYFFMLALCTMVVLLFLIEMRRHRLIAITGNGASVVLEKHGIGKKEIEAAIRSTEAKPPAGLHDRVMQAIKVSGNIDP